MTSNGTEDLVNLDVLKERRNNLVYQVTQKRNDYPEHCVNYYSKILKKEQEQLKNTKFILPNSGTIRITSKYGFSTTLQQLFPFKESPINRDDLLLKLGGLLEEIKSVKEAVEVIDRNIKHTKPGTNKL